MFRLRNALLKDSMDFSLITKASWESYESMRNSYLRLDVLSLPFLYRKNSDRIYDISEFRVKNCLITPSLWWKLMMFLDQDEPIYT